MGSKTTLRLKWALRRACLHRDALRAIHGYGYRCIFCGREERFATYVGCLAATEAHMLTCVAHPMRDIEYERDVALAACRASIAEASDLRQAAILNEAALAELERESATCPQQPPAASAEVEPVSADAVLGEVALIGWDDGSAQGKVDALVRKLVAERDTMQTVADEACKVLQGIGKAIGRTEKPTHVTAVEVAAVVAERDAAVERAELGGKVCATNRRIEAALRSNLKTAESRITELEAELEECHDALGQAGLRLNNAEHDRDKLREQVVELEAERERMRANELNDCDAIKRRGKCIAKLEADLATLRAPAAVPEPVEVWIRYPSEDRIAAIGWLRSRGYDIAADCLEYLATTPKPLPLAERTVRPEVVIADDEPDRAVALAGDRDGPFLIDLQTDLRSGKDMVMRRGDNDTEAYLRATILPAGKVVELVRTVRAIRLVDTLYDGRVALTMSGDDWEAMSKALAALPELKLAGAGS